MKNIDDVFGAYSNNAKIFSVTAPYRNPYQGSAPRWLFVCAAGLLRSPTAATVAAKFGVNARSCGSVQEYALIPLSANLIAWADKIFFVNNDVYKQAIKVFEPAGLNTDIDEKAIIWEIPDHYNYGQKELVKILQDLLDPFIKNETTLFN